MTELLVKMTDINTIFQYEKNAKKHPAKQVDEIAKSILEFGFNVPILVDTSNVIASGCGRYLAAKKLNILNVPVVMLSGLTDGQIKKSDTSSTPRRQNKKKYHVKNQPKRNSP